MVIETPRRTSSNHAVHNGIKVSHHDKDRRVGGSSSTATTRSFQNAKCATTITSNMSNNNMNLNSLLEGMGHFDNDSFEEKVRRCIPSEFMLLASQDCFTQAQEDYYAMDHYNLPTHKSKSAVNYSNAGSVATCALLQLLYENPGRVVASSPSSSSATPISCLEMVQQIKRRVKQCSKIEAKPTMSSSRPLGPPRLTNGKYAPYYIVPPSHTTGKRHALLIGVKTGEGPILKGAHNDIDNMRQFLRRHCGFREADIKVLMDDGICTTIPTKNNILAEFRKLT